jgi:Fe-S cluster assembly iron-binding protein IscA
VLDLQGIRVFVDGFSAQYLNGVTIGYHSSMQGSGFTFDNPPTRTPGGPARAAGPFAFGR